MSSSELKHPSDRSLIAFNTGSLDDTRAAAVNRHLKACQPCRRRLVALSGEVEQVSASSPSSETIELGPAVTQRKVPWQLVGTVVGVNVVLLGLIAAWAGGVFSSKSPAPAPAPAMAKSDSVSPSQPTKVAEPATVTTTRSVPPVTTQPVAGEKEASLKNQSTPPSAKTALSDKPAVPVEESRPKPESTGSESARSDQNVSKSESAKPQSPPARPDTLPSAVPAAAKPTKTAKESLLQFFDGKDLTGWQGDAKVWHVEQGALVGGCPAAHTQAASLVSQRSYRDFDLRFEATIDETLGDCGVHFRSQVVNGDAREVAGPFCAISGKDAPHGQLTGSLLTESPLNVVRKAATKLAGRFVKPGVNRFHIRCQGKHILIEVNGAKMINAEFPALPDEGVIAWTLREERSPHKATFKITGFVDLADAPPHAAPEQAAVADTELLRAELQFEKAMKTADELLLKQFDQEIQKLQHPGKGGNSELAATVEHEKEIFHEKGLIPWSRPMRKSLLQYCKEFMTARKTIGNAFDRAIDRAEKSQNEARKEALLAEAARVLAPRPVAIWQFLNNGQAHREVYYSDGTYTHDDREDEGISRLWSLSGDDTVTLEYPDEKNPSNTLAWAYELSPDGKQLIGQRKNGSKFFWERIEN